MNTRIAALIVSVLIAAVALAIAGGSLVQLGSAVSPPPPAPPGLLGATPAATATPIAPAASSVKLSSDEIIRIAQKAIQSHGTATASSEALQQGAKGNLAGADDLAQYTTTYPLWLVTATGRFARHSTPDGTPTTYGHISIWIDGITGEVVKLQLAPPAPTVEAPAP